MSVQVGNITKKTTQQRKNKLSSIPAGHLYVSKFEAHTESCILQRKTSAKLLALLPAFQQAVAASIVDSALENVLKNIFAKTYERDGLTHNKIQVASKIICSNAYLAINDLYSELATLLNLLCQQNTGTRACYQLDSEDRFYYLFVMLKSSVDLLPALLPVIEIDGNFMKGPHYNGVCLLAIAKTGKHANVLIAIAWVPSETTNNFTWFFLNLKAGGVPLQNIATSSDRGKKLNSQKLLSDFSHDWLHLKNCTYHLAKYVCGKFGNNKYALKSLVFQITK
jgi:hypothetical protein